METAESIQVYSLFKADFFKISFSVDMKLYQNSGYSMDLSMGTLSRAVDHSWNCYNFPNFRVKGPGFPDSHHMIPVYN